MSPGLSLATNGKTEIRQRKLLLGSATEVASYFGYVINRKRRCFPFWSLGRMMAISCGGSTEGDFAPGKLFSFTGMNWQYFSHAALDPALLLILLGAICHGFVAINCPFQTAEQSL